MIPVRHGCSIVKIYGTALQRHAMLYITKPLGQTLSEEKGFESLCQRCFSL